MQRALNQSDKHLKQAMNVMQKPEELPSNQTTLPILKPRRVAAKMHYAADPEARKDAAKMHYAADTEAKKDAAKMQYAADPEAKKAAARASYSANPEAKRAASMAKYSANPDIMKSKFRASQVWQKQPQEQTTLKGNG